MGINGATNEFMEKLTGLIQASGLPVVNVRLCLEAVRLELMGLERQAIEQEKAQEAAKAKREGKADE